MHFVQTYSEEILPFSCTILTLCTLAFQVLGVLRLLWLTKLPLILPFSQIQHTLDIFQHLQTVTILRCLAGQNVLCNRIMISEKKKNGKCFCVDFAKFSEKFEKFPKAVLIYLHISRNYSKITYEYSGEYRKECQLIPKMHTARSASPMM